MCVKRYVSVSVSVCVCVGRGRLVQFVGLIFF